MSDPALAPAASNLANPPEPATAELAAAPEELKADPKWIERVKARDLDAFAEHTRLWRVAHGMPAEPTPVVNTSDVFAQQHERQRQEHEQHADTYRAAGLGEEPIYEILNRMPVTAEPASVARERTCPADAR
jgi:hypothetical protein